MRYFLLFLSVAVLAKISVAQTVPDYAVQLTAQTQQSPAQITLAWKTVTGATSYSVYRKAKGATSWGAAIATTGSTSHTDNAVAVDSAYEYKVVSGGGAAQGIGYIYAGIKNPAIHNRGSLLLLVDTLFTNSCSTEIKQLIQDISRDGWEIMTKDFPRLETVTNIKTYITSQYQVNTNLNAVLILGHIAVPYSGDQNPDGHPDHKGAWPADGFYGDMNGTWTDASVNNTAATRPENKNSPGDGKYDQILLPSPLELQVSRVDFANMPLFTSTEIQLMKSYLNRDHQYRTKQLSVIKRSLIDDNFGTMSGEAFAANGWRNFPPLVGKDSVASLDLIPTLSTTNYQWAYGCGGGTYTSASGVGTTTNFTTNNTNAIFTMLFGSYFGDWDAQNNFLRAPLCSNIPALTSCWAGRPNWFFHHMALGEHIGYSARLSQNNDYYTPLYTPSNFGASFVHTALMGDLTLRMDYMEPATNVALTSTPSAGAIVSWSASSEPGVIGYYVYRSNSDHGWYEKCSPLVTGNTYIDSAGINGKKFYMVRAAKVQGTPSGSYVNLSAGNVDSGNVTYPISIQQLQQKSINITLYPNPAKNELYVNIETVKAGNAELVISTVDGRKLFSHKKTLHSGINTIQLIVKDLPTGIYVLSTRTNDYKYAQKWIKTE